MIHTFLSLSDNQVIEHAKNKKELYIDTFLYIKFLCYSLIITIAFNAYYAVFLFFPNKVWIPSITKMIERMTKSTAKIV